jgi:Queuosine biosynthesis protein QueC
MPRPRRVVVATGLPPDALVRRRDYAQADLTLSWSGRRPNLVSGAERIALSSRSGLPPRLWDLLEIALAVTSADIAFLRDPNEAWVRSTSILQPVRDVEFWRCIEPQLAELLYVLSHDAYVFDFEPQTAVHQRVAAEAAPTADESDRDCVALLSGGVDSLAGAATLLAAGRRPLLVGHRPQNPAIVAAQHHAHAALRRRFGDEVAFASVACGARRAADPEYPYPGPAERETSQRTRSLLYLSLGAAACCATGCHTLYCPENGVLALNVPLTEARVGGYSTASTRPRTFAGFTGLMQAIGYPLQVENPFVYQTKAQLVRDVLKPQLPPADIQNTVSCWMAGRYSRPCGGCIPCLIRAIAMELAGLPREAYLIDPLGAGGEAGPESAARASLVDLLTFAHRFRTLDDLELTRTYPVLLDFPPEVALRPAVAMLRQFAQEVEEVLGVRSFRA